MTKGIFLILLCYWAGTILSGLIGNSISAGVIGMILLFLTLLMKKKLAPGVEPAARFLLDQMLLFFLPAAVGIMECTDLLRNNIWAILVSAALSTLWVLWVTGCLAQKWEIKEKQ